MADTPIYTLIGVVIGAAIPFLRDVYFHSFQREKDAEYLAVRVICELDTFVNICLNVIYDDGREMGRGEFTSGGEEHFPPKYTPPKTLDFPPNLDWKSIDANLMYRILALPNKLTYTYKYIKFASEISFAPDYEELYWARYMGYADLGLEAISIIEALWTRYDIRPDHKDELYIEIQSSKKNLIDKKAEIEKL